MRSARHVGEAIKTERPALAHALLSTLRCREAVTTNYDDLYEQAVRARGGDVRVPPIHRPQGVAQWILKMHGDLKERKSIVLTRSQFVRFMAISEPSGAVLQTMLLTKHLLVVGTSMTDPNVLRLIHEVSEYRAANRSLNAKEAPDADIFGTVLDISAEPAREQLHRVHSTGGRCAAQTSTSAPVSLRSSSMRSRCTRPATSHGC